jgi:GNAT superfamily N-acetyltransferase
MQVHVAQFNAATLVAATDDPHVAGFMDALDPINALADRSPGFVWRLQDTNGNLTQVRLFDNPLTIPNLSVWESVEALKDYVYTSEHVEFFRRRAEWFERGERILVLWYLPAGTLPGTDEALRRLRFQDRHGASPYAFGFARPPEPLVFEQTTPDDAQTLDLISSLNHELTELADDPNENHFTLEPEQVTGDQGRMVRAWYAGHYVGCGAVRRIAPGVGEIKRMYVDPGARRLKLGAAILDQLELWAGRLGMTELKLETGFRQPAAIGLYERFGFERCEPWGAYLATPATSICYRKLLVDHPA